jgi:hypothetical protein
MIKGQVGIALALAILLLIVVFAPVPGDTRALDTLHNAAHGPIFGCVALLILAWLRRRPATPPRSRMVEYAIAFTGAIVLGIVTEIGQALTGRDASWLDARNDAVGAMAFVLLFFAYETRAASNVPTPARAAAACVALGMLAFLAAPLAHAAFEYRQRNRSFPTIADFTHDYDRYFIYQQNAELTPVLMPAPWAQRAGESALGVKLLPGEYPGIEFAEPRSDWSAYHTLVMDLTNPGAENLRFRLRIHDVPHTQALEDRYNGAITLRAGHRETIRIPLEDVRNAPRGRALRLDEIAGMMMFLLEPTGGEFLLSRVWLE